jgi:hypothetical protein
VVAYLKETTNDKTARQQIARLAPHLPDSHGGGICLFGLRTHHLKVVASNNKGLMIFRRRLKATLTDPPLSRAFLCPGLKKCHAFSVDGNGRLRRKIRTANSKNQTAWINRQV